MVVIFHSYVNVYQRVIEQLLSWGYSTDPSGNGDLDYTPSPHLPLAKSQYLQPQPSRRIPQSRLQKSSQPWWMKLVNFPKCRCLNPRICWNPKIPIFTWLMATGICYYNGILMVNTMVNTMVNMPLYHYTGCYWLICKLPHFTCPRWAPHRLDLRRLVCSTQPVVPVAAGFTGTVQVEDAQPARLWEAEMFTMFFGREIKGNPW